MTRLRPIVLLLLLVLAGPAAAQDRLAGRYGGIDAAAGAVLEIAPDAEGFAGTIRDARGRVQAFQADRVGEAAEAIVDLDGRTILMRVVPLPYGAEVALIPIDPNGAVRLDIAEVTHFLREGTRLPDFPADFVPAPRDPGARITGNSFLASYEFWDPTGVRDGYLALPDRFRTVMRFFPAVQLDVIWKLCLAPGAEAALGQALRGQGVACSEVVEGIAALQRRDRFDAYKAEVAAEREILRQSVRCADAYVESKTVCDQSARDVAAAATSLQTAATVLARFR